MTRQEPEAEGEGGAAQESAPKRRILFSAMIAAAFILFTCFYNETIHHLMIQSDYVSAMCTAGRG